MNAQPHDSGARTPFADLLGRQLPFLQNCLDAADCDGRAAEILATFVRLLQRMEQTLCSELESLAKHHPQIKPMAQALTQQRLLDIERTMAEAMGRGAGGATRVTHYSELMFRWWSAILAGVQSTVLHVPHELDAALNFTDWPVQRKRWSSEDSTYWDHFKFVIRSELPLRMADRLKNVRGAKTLEAYSILGQSSDQSPLAGDQ